MFDGCLDVSHHNGTIRWSKVYEAGYRLVFIKATQGTRFVDPAFRTNQQGAESAGLLVVPYHFINTEDGNLQAAHFADVAKLSNQKPYMLDWERSDTLPPIKILEALGTNLKIQTGRNPLVYRGMFEGVSHLVESWPLFVARWSKNPPDIKWLFWQDTAKMAVPGIKGSVDRDRFIGTLEELTKWFDMGYLPAALVPEPEVDSTSEVIIVTQIRAIQKSLQIEGYYKGRIDGDPGPLTVGALTAWRERL